MPHGFSFLRRFSHKGQGRATSLHGIRARTRLLMAAVVGLGVVLFAIGAWRAVSTFDAVKREVRLRGDAIASRVANRLALALNDRLADLRFVGQSLLGSRTTPAALDAPIKKALGDFLASHPVLRDINLLNARGNRILWSVRPQSPRPILPPRRFHALRDDTHIEVGEPVYARRFHAVVIPLRYRIVPWGGGAGTWLIGDPLDLSRLGVLLPRTRLTIRLATRAGRPLALWDGAAWRAPAAIGLRPAGAARARIPGYPWGVTVLWSRGHLWGLWWRHVARWLPLFLILLWGSQYMGLLLVNLLSQEMQLRLWHEGFHRLNQAIRKEPSPGELFADAARMIQGNLDAPLVLVGWRGLHAAAGSAGEAETRRVLDAVFATAADSRWRVVAQDALPLCMVLALGATGAIVAVCPSRRARTVAWYEMVRELAGHLAAAIDQRQQRLEIGRLQRYQAAVRIMQLELLRQPTPEEAQSLLVRILAEQTDIIGAFVAVPEPTGPRLLVQAAAAQDPEVRAALLRLTPSRDPGDHPFGQMLAGRAFRSGTPHGPADPHGDPDLAAAIAGLDALAPIRAVLAYPILEDGREQPSAVLVVDGTDPEYFTPALRALLEHLVASVRLALNAHRTRRQTDRYRAFYEALARASQAIARAGEVLQMFRNICHILVECTGVPLTFISLSRPDGVAIVASAGSSEDFLPVGPAGIDPLADPLGILHTRTMGANGPCLFEGREQWLEGDALRRRAEALGLVSALTVPWTQGDGVAGVLGIVAGERGFFDEDLTQLMEAFGHDISFAVSDYERRQELTRLSLYDSLTMLPNRAYFERSTASAIARAQRCGRMLALGILDLDGFKEWNDLQGHAEGDHLLKAVAQRLREVVREGEGVARLGGDEFGLAVSIDNLDALTALSGRLLAAVALADPERRVTASLGWATHTAGAADYGTLLVQADEALYAAKAAGRNAYRIFGGDIAERLTRRLAIHRRFPEALAGGQILFALQPQAHCMTGRIEGVELLARWRDGDTLIPAERFMPDVEKDPRLIRALGRYALGAAVALRDRLRAADHDLRVALNIGAHHFLYPAFLDEVVATLDGSSASGLCIEVTEDVVSSDVRRAADIMSRLKGLGFSVALDDFGKGHSSLTEAIRLPVDEIKLDHRFVRLFRRDPNAFAVAGAALLLGGLSGRRLIAEGIETPDDLTLWRHMGGEYIQGHLLAGPLAEEAFLAWLAANPSSPLAPVSIFPPRDLVLAGYAFLEPDDGVEDFLRTGRARLREWMQLRADLYGRLPHWRPLEAVLDRDPAQTSKTARESWRHELRSALLGLFDEVGTVLRCRPGDAVTPEDGLG